jgi:hypothetical protein
MEGMDAWCVCVGGGGWGGGQHGGAGAGLIDVSEAESKAT